MLVIEFSVLALDARGDAVKNNLRGNHFAATANGIIISQSSVYDVDAAESAGVGELFTSPAGFRYLAVLLISNNCPLKSKRLSPLLVCSLRLWITFSIEYTPDGTVVPVVSSTSRCIFIEDIGRSL